MGIVSTTENTRQTTTSKAVSGLSWVGDLKRVFSIALSADTDQIEAPIIVCDATTIPQLWDPHPYDPYLYVSSIKPTQVSPLMWDVEINYTRSENPFEQEIRPSWTHETNNEPVDIDRDGEPITNSSLETYENPIETTKSDLVMRFEYAALTYDDAIADEYKDSVNQYPFFGKAAGNCLLRLIDGTPDRIGAVPFYRITIEIAIRDDGWARRRLDEGYRVKTGTDGDGMATWKTLTDEDGKPLTSPVMLDGSGAQLADAEDPVYNTHYVNKEKDWAWIEFLLI